MRNTFSFLKKHAELKFGVPNQLSRRTAYYAIITAYFSEVFLTEPSDFWPYEDADSLPAPGRVTIEGIIQRADFSVRFEKQHQRFSIKGVWDMKRRILLLTLLCAIIVFSILFSVLGCTAQPGSGGSFSVTVHNLNDTDTLLIRINGRTSGESTKGHRYSQGGFSAADRVTIFNARTGVYLKEELTGQNRWTIDRNLIFTYWFGPYIDFVYTIDEH